MIDLCALGGATELETGELTFTFASSGASRLWLDDVMLIDNHETIIDTVSAPATGPATGGSGLPPAASASSGVQWTVKRRGLSYVIDAPGRFSFALATADAQKGGWSVVEASPLRVRFASAAPPGSATVYPEGRVYWGDSLRIAAPMASAEDAAVLAAQHASPARVYVPESMGRPDRTTDGDANNDGYNEMRGAYPIVANGGRLEATVVPASGAIAGVVLEIAGLPPGELRVAMDGLVVERAVRLKGGGVLIELPGRLNRPATVNVRVDSTRGR
jgi:hypothetical protein